MEKREEKISFALKSHPPLVLAEKEKKRGGGGGVTSMFARNTISRIMWDSTSINFWMENKEHAFVWTRPWYRFSVRLLKWWLINSLNLAPLNSPLKKEEDYPSGPPPSLESPIPEEKRGSMDFSSSSLLWFGGLHHDSRSRERRGKEGVVMAASERREAEPKYYGGWRFDGV